MRNETLDGLERLFYYLFYERIRKNVYLRSDAVRGCVGLSHRLTFGSKHGVAAWRCDSGFVGVAAPAATLITWLALRRRDEQSPANTAAPRYSIPMPQSPPQYWVMPTVQPATPPNYMAPTQRQMPPANPQLSWTQPPEF